VIEAINMSLEVHKAMEEPKVPLVSNRKELPPYETRIKKATANLARRMQKNKK
jgi:hypothetical protein